MADDFSNLRDFKKSLLQSAENGADLKQTHIPKPAERVCFVITKNKNSSWVDDLDAQERLNQITRVYH